MAEADKIFGTKVKYEGVFSFKDFYKFCYNWLVDETGLDITEKKYSEKIKGGVKDIDIEWEGVKKLSDYFMFSMKVEFKIIAMADVEINQNGVKMKSNKGEVGIKVSSKIVRDYDGKFEVSPTQKFIRAIYEKWIIKTRIDAIENKIIGDSDEFLGQAKAFLDIEGKSRH
jgi:hypothetical protein